MSDSLVIVDSVEKAEVCKQYFANKSEVIVSLLPVATPKHKSVAGKTGVMVSFAGYAGSQELLDVVHRYLDKEIYLVFDGDARSQYLAWLISSYVAQISKNKAEPKVLYPLGVTTKELDAAMQYVNIADEKGGLNFYIRALFDAYLGKHLRRLIGTNKGPGNLPLNYASLATLFLLADREEEIKAFVPQPKWEVEAKMRMNGQFFTARLLASYDIMADGSVKVEEEAQHLITLIQDDEFVVEVVQRDELVISPPAPFALAELLHEALNLGMQPKVVLSSVRHLSHGVKKADGTQAALISTVFPVDIDAAGVDLQTLLRAEVVAGFGEDNTGDAHLRLAPGMICPLDPKISGDDLQGLLSDDEMIVYDLIRSRALASQMQAATGEYLQVEIAAGPESIFRVNFRSVKKHGFLQTYKGNYDKELLAPCPFADISEEQSLDLIKLSALETLGLPAEKYNIESLFADLADFSVFPEPTAILMFQAMFDNGYICSEKNGYLSSGPKAAQVTSIIAKIFPRMFGVNLSAYIEQTMEEAVSGRKDLDFALKQFEQTLMLQGKSLVKVKIPSQVRARKRSSSFIIKQPDEVQAQAEPEVPISPAPATNTDQTATTEAAETVPDVTGEAVDIVALDNQQKESDLNADITVSSPEVEAESDLEVETVVKEQQVVVEDEVLAAGGRIEGDSEPLVVDNIPFDDEEDEWPDELKKAFEQALSGAESDEESVGDVPAPPGQDEAVEELDSDQKKECRECGKQMRLKKDRFGKFWSCSGFPVCRHTESFTEDKAVKMSCPVCTDGEIAVKRTPTGKDFYVCLKDNCEFIAWSRPHYVQCMACDSPYLVEKKSLRGVLDLRCPRAGCDYSRPLVGEDEQTPAPKKKKVRVRRVKKGAAVSKSGTGKKKVRIVRRKKK